jgi:hypothetical protein
MAHGDRRGKGKLGDSASEAFYRATAVEADLSQQSANIVVGEFLSELAAAIRFRMKIGQTQGDWIEEPERLYTDGGVFATEEAVASEVKLQITVTLDASTSMWNNGIMKFAGPTFAALDQIIRASMRDLPEGSVHYAPFVFHEKAFKIPASLIPTYTARVDWGLTEQGKKRKERMEAQGKIYEPLASDKRQQNQYNVIPQFPPDHLWNEAVRFGEVPAGAVSRYWKKDAPFRVHRTDKDGKDKLVIQHKDMWVSDYAMSGIETFVAPLFEAIQKWEQEEGDISATRLDIVITDGVFQDAQDVARASRIQEDRNGRLKTVLLNFVPSKDWENVQLPERCSQFQVTPRNLDNSIRTILTDAIGDLFGA